MIISMNRLREQGYLFAAVAIFIFSALSGCSSDNAENDAAAATALNRWWEAETQHPAPVRAGTVTPAHTINSTTGRSYAIPQHVQTKKEAEDEAADARWQDHRLAIVKGFSVRGNTVTVITNLTGAPTDSRDAQDLCHEHGAFVWANDNRHFGMQDIRVTGANGELLSSRIGLRGTVQ